MKNWYQSLSLPSKQILIIIFINAFSLLIASALYFYNSVSSYQERQIHDLYAKAKVVSGTLTSSLLFQDAHAAHQQLTSLDKDKNVLYAGIFDTEQNFFANYIASDYFDKPNLTQYSLGIHYLANKMVLVEKVFLNQEKLGYLLLVQDTTDLKEQMINHGLITLIVFIMSLLLAYLLSRFMQRWLSKPIQDLVNLIQHITSSNDFSQRLTVKTKDEIGLLMGSFNSMIQAIETKDKKLKAHGDELQDLVNIRTKQLFQRANYDQLTQLPNRHFFIGRLENKIKKMADLKIQVLFIDLDRFQTINDELGHIIADQVLKITAKRINRHAEHDESVARITGDQFALFSTYTTNDDSKSKIEKIKNTLETIIEIHEKAFHLTACIGISHYPKDATDAFTLLKMAETSSKKAKQKGAGSLIHYHTEFNHQNLDRLTLETRLRTALKQKKLSLVYQPKIDIKNNRLEGVEALIRWQDDELGFIPPSRFIPLAEEIGIIDQIGTFVIESCCKQHAEWRLLGLDPVKIALNLSPSHLAQPSLIETIKSELFFYKISPEYIELEITEETFLDADEFSQKNLNLLHQMGVSIALDDFGTGYSCLSYLLDIPVTTLKIDGSFIKKLGTRPENDGIVNAILTLGHGLRLKVVAECVETEDQLRFLKNNYCDIIQGYYFSKPLSAQQLVQYIQTYFPQSLKPSSLTTTL